MTDAIREAQAVLQQEADKLTEMLAAKGYPDAHAQIWIGWERGNCHFTTNHKYNSPDPRVRYVAPEPDVVSVLSKARDAISGMPARHDPSAYAPYFAWPQADAAE